MAKKSPASILKSKGLIPKDWDLRSLTDYKRRVIRKRANEYAEVIKYPEKFKSRVYKPEKANRLLDAGFSGVGQHILIPNRGGTTLSTHVKADTVTIDRGDRIETVYLSNGRNFLRNLQRKFDKPLGPGEYWAFKVGDNNTFLQNHHKDLRQLMRYGESIQFTNADAKNYVHLVKIQYKDHRDTHQLPYNPNNPADPSNYKKPRAKKWVNKRGK